MIRTQKNIGKRDNLTTGEVAIIFGVSIPTVRRWCEMGDLSFFLTPGGEKRGGHKRITKESVKRKWQTFFMQRLPGFVDEKPTEKGAKKG